MTPLEQITRYADELTEPHINREPYTIWTGSRNRQTLHHVTVQHGLLTRLYRAVLTVQPGTEAPGAAGVAASRPPLEVEALSRHTQITAAANTWSKTLGIDPRPTAESTIRGLVGAASHHDDQDQRALAGDLRRWVGWCRVYLGLEHIRRITGVRCLLADCNTLGSLRINLTTSHGLCTACGATWDRDSIGVLAEHITTAREVTA